MKSVNWIVGYIEGRIDSLNKAEAIDRRNQPSQQDEIIRFYSDHRTELETLLAHIKQA